MCGRAVQSEREWLTVEDLARQSRNGAPSEKAVDKLLAMYEQ